MRVGVPREQRPGEDRVALVPDAIRKLAAGGHEVWVEAGAGVAAGFTDDAYADAGATLTDGAGVYGCPVVVVVETVAPHRLAAGTVLAGLLRPLDEPATMFRLAAEGVTSLAFELVPRTTRAQQMDALSSQASVAGYQAALEAASASRRLFPMMTTAAGTIAPSKVLVLGAGVAGLQAIATCRRLGAVVSAFDVRAAAAEQVRSLGANFVEAGLPGQDASATGGYARQLDPDDEEQVLAALAPHVAGADVVISTAAIPGRRAPRLITATMVEEMRSGSVIVDLAATTGGNCELTVPGEMIHHYGVMVIGYTNLPSRKAHDASLMYARNVAALLGLLGPDGEPDFEDQILDECCVTHQGEVRLARIAELAGRA